MGCCPRGHPNWIKHKGGIKEMLIAAVLLTAAVLTTEKYAKGVDAVLKRWNYPKEKEESRPRTIETYPSLNRWFLRHVKRYYVPPLIACYRNIPEIVMCSLLKKLSNIVHEVIVVLTGQINHVDVENWYFLQEEGSIQCMSNCKDIQFLHLHLFKSQNNGISFQLILQSLCALWENVIQFSYRE